MRIPLALLSLSLLAACGSPPVPGQHAQACVNATLGGIAAPAPSYVEVMNSDLSPGVAAQFSNGVVLINPREADARLMAHESVRQWGMANGLGANPGPEYFAEAERACGMAVEQRRNVIWGARARAWTR